MVLEEKNGSYDVISGRQRLRCWKLLGKTHCHCCILSKQHSLEDILTLVVEDQFSSNQLNNIEQACFVQLCRKHLPKKHRFQSFIEQLLPGRITKGIRFLQSLSGLDVGLQYKMHTGSISDKITTDLLRLSDEDKHQFAYLAETLQLRTNNQKKLIQQLDDILKRENISLVSLINQRSIQKIIGDNHLEKVRKASALLAEIHRLHQPRLSAAQDEFSRKISNLMLPESCSLSPSRSFESKTVTLSVQFDNYNKFEKKWSRIREILEE